MYSVVFCLIWPQLKLRISQQLLYKSTTCLANQVFHLWDSICFAGTTKCGLLHKAKYHKCMFPFYFSLFKKIVNIISFYDFLPLPTVSLLLVRMFFNRRNEGSNNHMRFRSQCELRYFWSNYLNHIILFTVLALYSYCTEHQQSIPKNSQTNVMFYWNWMNWKLN